MPDAPHLPVDDRSAAPLADRGLRLALVDGSDADAVRDWRESVARGFLDPWSTAEQHAEALPDAAGHRLTAVFDDTLAEARYPVATAASWPAALSLPGGDVDAWAVTSVTVAPTHRRRGVARALLEAELRTAAAAGLPIAMLTASEATLYARYGFGPAAWVADLRIDARRLRYTGPEVPGRVQLVGRATILEDVPRIFEAARRRIPGGVHVDGLLLTRLFGRMSDDAGLRAHRFARYDDADGVPQGYVAYTAVESPEDVTASRIEVHHLAAATADAEAALWRFLIEHDLIGEVVAQLRSVDEPVRWLVDDPRAVRTTAMTDHLWLRVLDPVAALEARRYLGPGRLDLEIADPLGYADGRIRLVVDEHGGAAAGPVEAATGPALALDVSALGSLLLGGVRATTLAATGRIRERAAGDAAAADALLASPVAPWLGVWF